MTIAATGQRVLTEQTTHCFTGTDGKPLILRKQFPDFHRVLKELAEARAE